MRLNLYTRKLTAGRGVATLEEGAAERTAAQVAMAESVAAAENIHELEQAAAEAAAEEVNGG